MRTKHILGIVITYNPDEDLLKDNINAFADHIDEIIIWDNTPNGSLVAKRIAEDRINSRYITEEENKGISYVLNKAWHYAADNGYDFLLTMDQDSIWQDFENYLNTTLSRTAPEGIYGPEVRTSPVKGKTFLLTDYVITSGMLISVKILNLIKGYKSDFFVDGIDMEMCLRAKSYGIPTFRISNCHLQQRFGTPQTITICGLDNHTNNYPSSRIHEILKSHTYILLNYSCSFSLQKKIVLTYFWKVPWKIILFESDKGQKLKAYCKGIIEGKSVRPTTYN